MQQSQQGEDSQADALEGGGQKGERRGKEGRKGEVQSKIIERKVRGVGESNEKRKKQKRERKTKTDQKRGYDRIRKQTTQKRRLR